MSVPSPSETQQAASYLIEAAAGSALFVGGLILAEKVVVGGLNAISNFREKRKPPYILTQEDADAFFDRVIGRCIDDVRNCTEIIILDEDFNPIESHQTPEEKIAGFEWLREAHYSGRAAS